MVTAPGHRLDRGLLVGITRDILIGLTEVARQYPP